jgi:hypothetical protein
MSVPIWHNEPSILLNKDYLLEIWPRASMDDYNQKVNAIVRLVILLTLIGTLLSKSIKFLLIGMITLGVIFIICNQKVPAKEVEGFSDKKVKFTGGKKNDVLIDPLTLDTMIKSDYQAGTAKNPFGNVLLPEIKYNSDRKPATPAFNPEVAEDITKNTKKMIQQLNPGIKNTDKQLFGSMTDEFYLEQSNRVFNSTPNTRVTNDQGAFAQYLYGDMPSCKDGDGIACVQDNYRYILY